MAFLLPGFVRSIHQSFASTWHTLWTEPRALSIEMWLMFATLSRQTVFLQPLNEGAGWRPPLRCGVREPCPWPCSAGKESENSLNSHCPVVKCCYWLLLLDDKIFDCTHSPCSCKIVVKYLPPVTQHDAVYQVSWINEMLCSCLDILKWGSLRWYLGFYNLGDTSRTSAMT
jgi:hypothetical protein